MTGLLEGRLPDWSRSRDPDLLPDYSTLPGVAREFTELDQHGRRDEIGQFSSLHCFPRFQLADASGLYLFLRVVFVLPVAIPREQARTYGGWLHPSTADSRASFTLSWPVVAIADDSRLLVESFTGYFGKGYDAAGEYDYFVDRFPMRDGAVLARSRVESAD